MTTTADIQLLTYAQYCQSVKTRRMADCGCSAAEADLATPTHSDWLRNHAAPAIAANPSPSPRRVRACIAAYPDDFLLAVRAMTGLVWDGVRFVD